MFQVLALVSRGFIPEIALQSKFCICGKLKARFEKLYHPNHSHQLASQRCQFRCATPYATRTTREYDMLCPNSACLCGVACSINLAFLKHDDGPPGEGSRRATGDQSYYLPSTIWQLRWCRWEERIRSKTHQRLTSSRVYTRLEGNCSRTKEPFIVWACCRTGR